MVSLADFERAVQVLRGKILRTPLIYSPTFSKLSGAEVYLKLENLQETGSFKMRGATFKIQSNLDRIGPEGVVAASAGNHAQGVALAARRAGLNATILMPEWASISKQEATRGYGGKVLLEGKSVGEAILRAQELGKSGKLFIHPFNDLEIIAGQGTIGLEIHEDLKDPDFIFIPIGGGGLISGIATAAKSLWGKVRIVGVQTAGCPSAYLSVKDGKITRMEPERSIADGIIVKELGDITFPIIRLNVDEIVLVEEGQIVDAMLTLLERKRVLAEGAGAVPLAALLGGSVKIPSGSKVVLVISGGNVDTPLLERVMRQGLFRNGRIMRISACLDDAPGALARLLSVVADLRANVLHLYHYRSGRDLPVHLSRVELELETRGASHVRDIALKLKSAGYLIESRSHEPFAICQELS